MQGEEHMTTIYWCPVLGIKPNPRLPLHSSMEIFFQQPDPLFKAIAEQYKGAEFLECPSVQDMCKNTFVIRAPFDVEMSCNEEGHLVIDRLGQMFYDSFCHRRPDGSVETAPSYLFYSDIPTKAEFIPVFLLKSSTADNVQIGRAHV